MADPKPHSKTKFKHYGEWFAGNRPLNFQDRLKIAIDAALAQSPGDFAAFLSLMEAAGYEVKHGRGGAVSFRTSGQERFTRLWASTLGDGYGPEDIKAAISGTGKRTGAPARKINLVVDIQAKLKAGKGPGYERWAKIFNLKQMAAALAYLQQRTDGIRTVGTKGHRGNRTFPQADGTAKDHRGGHEHQRGVESRHCQIRQDPARIRDVQGRQVQQKIPCGA